MRSSIWFQGDDGHGGMKAARLRVSRPDSASRRADDPKRRTTRPTDRVRGRGSVVLSALLLFFGFLAATATAQTKPALADLGLEDLMKLQVESVFGASKFLQKVIDAPAAVSVVTARDIEVFGYRTLADAIRSAPGFNVTDDRNYSYVGVRGFQRPGDYNSRVLLLVDGHRMNDPIYNQAYIGTEFPIDVELIERIELIRGPASSIYGTNAFFAVINVVTKKGPAASGLRISGDAGSLYSGRGRAAFGASFDNGLELLVSASRYGSRGQTRVYYPEFDGPETNNGVAQNLDRVEDYNLFTSLSFKGVSFQGVYGSRNKKVPTAAFGTWFDDQRFMTTDAQGWADLRYVRSLPGTWLLTSRVNYDLGTYDGRYPYNYSETDEPSVSVSADYAHFGWWGTEVDIEKTFARRHKVTAGAEYRNNFRLHQGVFDLESGEATLDDRRASQETAVFVEDQFTISSKLTLNAGIRSDHYETFGSTTNPRLALIFHPAATTAIKALWGTAFRAPNGYELYYRSDVIKPNPDLRPETIRTGQLVVERYFSDHYRVMANVYSSNVRHLVTQIVASDGFIVSQNLDSAQSRGVEIEFEGKWHDGIASRLSFSYQRARNLVTGEPLVNSARQLAAANLTVPLIRRRVFAGLDLQYVGRVETLGGSFTDRVVVPNLTVTTRDLHGGLSLSANVYNLFNATYGYPGGDEHRQNIIYQYGRTFRVGLEYAWQREK
jgi:outer membrane receptor for ferrienterochelin and colicins